jgi:hypothetical protein
VRVIPLKTFLSIQPKPLPAIPLAYATTWDGNTFIYLDGAWAHRPPPKSLPRRLQGESLPPHPPLCVCVQFLPILFTYFIEPCPSEIPWCQHGHHRGRSSAKTLPLPATTSPANPIILHRLFLVWLLQSGLFDHGGMHEVWLGDPPLYDPPLPTQLCGYAAGKLVEEGQGR